MNSHTAFTSKVAIGIHGNRTFRRSVAALVVTTGTTENDVVASTAEQSVSSTKGRKCRIDVIISCRLTEPDDYAVVTKNYFIAVRTFNNTLIGQTAPDRIVTSTSQQDVMTHMTGYDIITSRPGQSRPYFGELVQGVMFSKAMITNKKIKAVIAFNNIIFRTAKYNIVAIASVDDIGPAIERNIGEIIIKLNGFKVGREIEFVGQMQFNRNISDLGIIDPSIIAENDLCTIISAATINDIVSGTAKNNV